jgi:hypothetical protein
MKHSATVRELRRELEASESACRQLRERVRAAEERALLAERSAQDAWTFTKTMFRIGKVATGRATVSVGGSPVDSGQ